MKEITDKEFYKLSTREQNSFTGIINRTFSKTRCEDLNNPFVIQNHLHNGISHRIDGPAIIWSHGKLEYYINGERVSKEAQELYHSLMKLKNLI